MSDTFIGDAGIGIPTDDLVFAGSSFTKLYGIAGNDDLGTDVAGRVYLDGGDGDDLIYTLWAPAVSAGDFYGGNGDDRIEGGASATGDLIYGGDGDDWVNQNPTGPGGSDYIEGGQGRDGLYGAGGNDTIYGGDGDDSGGAISVAAGDAARTADPGLFGGAGDDYLDGGRGADLLVGGLGIDTQVGGQGNDIFDFNAAAESTKGALRDLILDFKKGDRIDLSDIVGGLDFIGKKGFHGDAGEVRFKKGILQADFDGNGKGEFEIGLDGVTKLKDADFVL